MYFDVVITKSGEDVGSGNRERLLPEYRIVYGGCGQSPDCGVAVINTGEIPAQTPGTNHDRRATSLLQPQLANVCNIHAAPSARVDRNVLARNIR
jgi:hypothetical protein